MALDVERLYRTYGPMVMRRCRALLGDEEAAADAMQDTFVRVLEYRERLNDHAPSSLLYTMATRVCLNRLRRARRMATTTGGDALDLISSDDDGTDRILDRAVAESILAGLSDEHRQTALEHYLNGNTLAETAARQGMSISGVRKRLLRVGQHARRMCDAGAAGVI